MSRVIREPSSVDGPTFARRTGPGAAAAWSPNWTALGLIALNSAAWLGVMSLLF